MFVKMLLDPETLLQSRYNRIAHTRFLEAWIDSGIGFLLDIHLKDDYWISNNVERILDPNIQTLWKNAWTLSKEKRARSALRIQNGDYQSLDTRLAQLLSGHTDLIVTHPEKAMNLTKSQKDTNCEISLFDEIDQSLIYKQRASLRWDGNIPESTPIEEIWTARFKDQFNAAKHVTIVDGYALHESNYRGLENFLLLAFKHNDNSLQGKNITLYCAPSDKLLPTPNVGPGHVEKQIVGEILLRLGDQQDWPTLEIFINPSRAYHDRHVRIGNRVVYPLGKGLDIFNTPNFLTKETSTIAFLTSIENCISEEQKLKGPKSTYLRFPTVD